MSDLDALLAGIVANPHEGLRWLVLADWLDDHGQPERAELLRLHRELLRTCTEPEAHPERPAIHSRIMELMRVGVEPCVPRMTLQLPGGVELPTVFIPPGSFRMGSPDTEAGHFTREILHEERLTMGLFFGESPVTQAQWMAVMADNPSNKKGDTLPVENVSWTKVQEFCAKLSELTGEQVRLPTEAEWEYSARAGTSTPFYWGEQFTGTEANCRGSDVYGTESEGPFLASTSPVGSYSSVCPHPWGLQDILGNVSEWCSDRIELGSYSTTNKYDGTEGWDNVFGRAGRAFRGGAWPESAHYCRAAYRSGRTPGVGYHIVGFRIAVTPSGQS